MRVVLNAIQVPQNKFDWFGRYVFILPSTKKEGSSYSERFLSSANHWDVLSRPRLAQTQTTIEVALLTSHVCKHVCMYLCQSKCVCVYVSVCVCVCK